MLVVCVDLEYTMAWADLQKRNTAYVMSRKARSAKQVTKGPDLNSITQIRRFRRDVNEVCYWKTQLIHIEIIE
jgi:hypothetical protein